MNSKVIYLQGWKKQQVLSKNMLSALMEASTKQQRGIPFGPADIKGSVSSLIRRGLIVYNNTPAKGHLTSAWQLTNEATNILRSLGVDKPC